MNTLIQIPVEENQSDEGNVFIVTENPCVLIGIEQLKIVKVAPAQEKAFLKKYAGRIIEQGCSVQDVLMKFGRSVGG